MVLALFLATYIKTTAYVGIRPTSEGEELVIVRGGQSTTIYETKIQTDPYPYEKRVRWFAPSPSGKFVAILTENGSIINIVSTNSKRLHKTISAVDFNAGYLVLPTWVNDKLIFACRVVSDVLRPNENTLVVYEVSETGKIKSLGMAADEADAAVRFLGYNRFDAGQVQSDDKLASEITTSITGYLNPIVASFVLLPSSGDRIYLKEGQLFVKRFRGRERKLIASFDAKHPTFLQLSDRKSISITVFDKPLKASSWNKADYRSPEPWFTTSYGSKNNDSMYSVIIDLATLKMTRVDGLICAKILSVL